MSNTTKMTFYRAPQCEEEAESTCFLLCLSGDGETESFVDSGEEFSW